MDNSLIVGIYLAVILLASLDVLCRVAKGFVAVYRKKQLTIAMRRLRKPVQPWVTVLVHGSDKASEKALVSTVRSLQASHYHAYDIVVVGKRARTYQTAYRKSRRGDIVVCLAAGVKVDPYFIKRAVAMRKSRRTWHVQVEQNTKPMLSIEGLMRSFSRVLWQTSSPIEVCIRAELHKKRILRRAVFSTSAVKAALYQAIVIGLVLVACLYGGIAMLWWCWLVVTVYVGARVWIDAGARLAEKWSLTVSVPSVLFFLPVASSLVGIFQLSSRK